MANTIKLQQSITSLAERVFDSSRFIESYVIDASRPGRLKNYKNLLDQVVQLKSELESLIDEVS